MATKARTSAKKAADQSHSGHGSHSTTDHREIQRWAEARGGAPACVRGTGGRNDAGVIRIDFPTGPEPSLEQISWDEWFEKFDESQLALVYQDKTASGEMSRFNKLVSRDTVKTDAKTPAKTRTAGGKSTH